MSQRECGYERKPFDQYETPAWVTLALTPHLPAIAGKVWEPACGSGKMVAALREAGFEVVGTDITRGGPSPSPLSFGSSRRAPVQGFRLPPSRKAPPR
jgi:hypothetical protein